MYLNIQYSSFESSFYYFSLFHLYIFTSLYLFIFSTFFFPPPTPLLRNKLIICIFIPVQGLRFGLGRTHRLANGTSQPCRSIACFRNVMPDISSVYLPQLHVVSPTGKKARERASFKVVAEAFPYSILLGLSVFRYTCNSPSTGAA